ncbi:PH domain-containing protein [Nonomuraea sp. NPDC059194]|uniref:PH domain-containing protein n=1 Tax=Nonomuraea sp. NPDC059194 TaxID=3346764 RepID=UPI0036ADF4E2
MAELTLRPPRNLADPRTVSWWTVQAFMLALPLVAAIGVAYWFFTPRPALLGAAAVAVSLACLLLATFAPRAYYRVQRWEITDEAVYVRTGWITHTWRVAPMSRVQTVDTARGPVQRLFGLADVTVTTASAAGAITIEGLDHELAAELAARLTAVTQATQGDAT